MLHHPRTDEGVDRNAVCKRVPKPHTGRLVFDLLPVARKYEDRHDQRGDKAGKDRRPRAEVPRIASAGNFHGDGVHPAQDHASEHAEEDLHFRVGVILLGGEFESDRVVEDE